MRAFMLLAVGALLLAASTGVLLRFGLYQGMPAWAQNYGAVRHAHSHLMYFGWATLAIMAMIWRFLPQWTQAPLPAGVRWQMGATTIVALLSLPAFWRNGYGVTEIGSLSLPLGAMVSGLNGLTWIAFVLLYVRATAQLSPRPLPVQLWDWALGLLLLAFVGGLGLVGVFMLDDDSLLLQQIMLHLFLDLFAAGWFVMALLGLLWSYSSDARQLDRWLPTQSLAFFLAPTFFLGISPTLLPPPIFWISAIANVIAAALLACHLVALWQRRASLPQLARFGLGALGVHLLIALLLLWPSLWQWSGGTQIRIFYLHNLLLGWVSSSLVGLALALWFPLARPWRHIIQVMWCSGIGLMLLALLAMGVNLPAHFPAIPFGVWLRLAAWGSLVVAGAIGTLFLSASWLGWHSPHRAEHQAAGQADLMRQG